jgi:hypothetical protein
MGKKIDSIREMYCLGLPAPRCVFIMENDSVEEKLEEYFRIFPGNERFCIRTDTNKSSMSMKRNLSASKAEMIELAHEWHGTYQVILQEYVGDQNEVKSGNIYLDNNIIVIEGAWERHHVFTNGKALDVNLTAPRFDHYHYQINRLYNGDCLNHSEILRLIRLARRVPYNKAIIEFSYVKNGSLFFWEIKKEVSNINKKR